GQPLPSRKAVVVHGLCWIFSGSPSRLETAAKVALRRSVPLLGGEAVVAHRLGLVLLGACSVGKTACEVPLGIGFALISGQTEVMYGFCFVFGCAPPCAQREPQQIL